MDPDMVRQQAEAAVLSVNVPMLSSDGSIQGIPAIKLFPWFGGINLHYAAGGGLINACGESQARMDAQMPPDQVVELVEQTGRQQAA